MHGPAVIGAPLGETPSPPAWSWAAAMGQVVRALRLTRQVTGGTSSATMELLNHPDYEEVPDEHGMRVGFASRPDHLRRLEVESGEVWRGRIWSPDRARFVAGLPTSWRLELRGGPVAVAVEGCTGWRYVVEEIVAAGFEAHVAEPADTQAARGRKKRAKTDRSDARLHARAAADRGAARIVDPARGGVGVAGTGRLYKTLLDQRRMWIQRIHAELFQHGVSRARRRDRLAQQTRDWLTGDTVQLSPAARQRISAGYPHDRCHRRRARAVQEELERFGRRQPACKALARAHYGIGPSTSNWLWHLSASGCETGNWISAASATRWTSRSRRWKREPRSGREAEEA